MVLGIVDSSEALGIAALPTHVTQGPLPESFSYL